MRWYFAVENCLAEHFQRKGSFSGRTFEFGGEGWLPEGTGYAGGFLLVLLWCESVWSDNEVHAPPMVYTLSPSSFLCSSAVC